MLVRSKCQDIMSSDGFLPLLSLVNPPANAIMPVLSHECFCMNIIISKLNSFVR